MLYTVNTLHIHCKYTVNTLVMVIDYTAKSEGSELGTFDKEKFKPLGAFAGPLASSESLSDSLEMLSLPISELPGNMEGTKTPEGLLVSITEGS